MVEPVKRAGKKTLYGAAAKAYRKAHKTAKKAGKKAKTYYSKAKKSYGGKMFGNALSGIDPLAIGIVGVGRKDAAPYAKRLGAQFSNDGAIQDEVGFLLASIFGPMVLPGLKTGLPGCMRKVLIDHEGVRLVAYMSGRGTEATGSTSFPAGGTGLW